MSPSSESDYSAIAKVKSGRAPGRFRFTKVLSRWWWVATLLIVAVTYVVSMIPSWMDMDGPLYESNALVEVRPIVDVDPTVSRGTGPAELRNRKFMNTQFEIISAPITLELALGKNDLLHRFGDDKTAAINRMKKSIKTTQRRGTDLIEISYRDEDAELARDAAEAVYQAYKDRREELEMSMRKEQLKAVKVELKNQQDRVAELSKRLIDVAAKVGLVWVEGEGDGNLQGQIHKLTDKAEKELYEAKREMRELTLQINKLLALPDDGSMLLLMELPDVNLKAAYKRYVDTQKELDSMKATGLAERHPDIQRRRARLLELQKDLDKRAGNVRQSLKHRLAEVEKRVEAMQAGANQDRGASKQQQMKELNVARAEYEMAQDRHDKMQMKYNLEKTKMVMPSMNTIVHQLPEQGGKPITRGRDFFVALGTLCSLPFSIGLGIILMYLAELILPRKG